MSPNEGSTTLTLGLPKSKKTPRIAMCEAGDGTYSSRNPLKPLGSSAHQPLSPDLQGTRRDEITTTAGHLGRTLSFPSVQAP